MKKYKILISIVLIAVAIISAGCKDRQEIITDMKGRNVTMPQKTDKVVCLSPGIAELFYKFGIEGKLIGRSYFCHLPEQIQILPEVGGLYKLDTNTIIEMKPDLVLSSDMLSWDARNFLYRREIPLVMFKDNKKFEDIYPAIELFGKIFKEEQKATRLTEELKKEFSNLNKANTDNKPTAYFYIQFNGKDEITVNENNLTGSLMTVAGFENIAKNDSDMKFSREELLNKDPEYIFVNTNKYDKLMNSQSYSSLSAVKNKKVIAINPDYLNHLSVSNLEFIKQIQAVTK